MGPQSGFNPSTGPQSGFNPSMGQSNNFNQPLGQTSNFNHQIIYNPSSAQINSLNQPKNYGHSPILNQQPTFQPIQSNMNNFSQVIPQSPNFNNASSIYNQRAPSGELNIYLRLKLFV